MSRTIEEQLSALLDGELPEEEKALVLRRLERDADHRRLLARYSLIGDCLRGAEVLPGALEIGDRVRVALDSETPISAPTPDAGRWRGTSRALLGAGIAATVAVLALVSLSTVDNGQSPVPTTAVTRDDGRFTTLSEISYTVPDAATRAVVIAPARLTNYLVSHGEYSNALARQTMDSHIVNYGPERVAREATEDPADE